MSFMMQIDAARRAPLDQLASDYFAIMLAKRDPTLDFCLQALGVPESDEAVARRLDVPIATVRGWRDSGRRARVGSFR